MIYKLFDFVWQTPNGKNKHINHHLSLSHFTMKKKDLIKHLQDCKAIQFGKFVLTSGAVSDYYIDIKKASTNPQILKMMAEFLSPYTKGYDLIAGMELGAVPLLVALSLETSLPYVIVRKEKRGHGTAKQIEGDLVDHKKVLIIEDVTTSGGSVVNTIHILREYKALVDKVIVVVDREAGAAEKLQDLDISFIPIITVSEIIKNSAH